MKIDFKTVKRIMFVLVTMTIIFAYMQVIVIEQWWRFYNFRMRLSRSLEYQGKGPLEMLQDPDTPKINLLYYDDEDIEESENAEDLEDDSEYVTTPDENKTDSKRNAQRYVDTRPKIMNITDFTEKPLMILFSSWSYNKEKEKIHSVLRTNWKSWSSIKPMVLTKDHKVQIDCRKDGWGVKGLSEADKTCYGPPVLSTMFTDVMAKHDAYFYGYSNADIVFGDGLRTTMESLFYHFAPWKIKPVLVVGRRYNVNFLQYQNESWQTPGDIKKMVKHGKLVIRSTDYFFTNKLFPWSHAPKVSIGRPFVVRSIIAWAIRQGYFVVDATRTIEAVHMTTQDGVYASWHVKGKLCNQHVLADFKYNIPLGIGHCECARLETFRGVNGTIQMRHRQRNKRICGR